VNRNSSRSKSSQKAPDMANCYGQLVTFFFVVFLFGQEKADFFLSWVKRVYYMICRLVSFYVFFSFCRSWVAMYAEMYLYVKPGDFDKRYLVKSGIKNRFLWEFYLFV